MNNIKIIGWFYLSKPADKTKEKKTGLEAPTELDLNRIALDERFYKISAKKVNIDDIVDLKMEKLQGGWWCPKKVYGFVDTAGSPLPFFVDEKEAVKLREKIV